MTRGLRLLQLLVTFPLISASPFQYSVFHGDAHPAAETRQKNKNWCAYVVHKNVSCAVVGGTESFAQPEFLPCPPEFPNCAQQVIYRTHFRPTYKIDYKTVTELAWRCCPGYQGYDCMEVKDMKLLQVERLPHQPSLTRRFPNPQAPNQKTEHQRNDPLLEEGQVGGQAGDGAPEGQGGPKSSQHLEEEVQRLSQMVLDMQARMTEMASNQRLEFQEEASKMLITLMSNHKQPASARGAETESFQVQDFSFERETTQMGEIMNKINQVVDDLDSKSNTLDDLLDRVNYHDGQIRLLMEGPQTPGSTPPTGDVDLRAYLDSQISALREELMEGMEIKMADLKNSCDYKILSVQEQCDGQEANYFSLTELMDSKEGDLRNEIRDLRDKVAALEKGDSGGSDSVLARLENIESHLNSSERTLTAQCLSVEENLQKEQEEVVKDLKKTLEEKMAYMEDKLTNLVAGRSTSSPFAGKKESLDVLPEDFNALKSSVHILEHKVKNMDRLFSEDCRDNLTALENLQKDFEGYKTVVDTMKMDVNVQMNDVELMKGQLLNHSRRIENVNEELGDLKDRLGRPGASVSDVVHQEPQTLQNLNSSWDQVKAGAEQEARELLELHRSQHQELRQQLDELSREVKAEADHCKETTRGVREEIANVDSRVVGVETLCSKLDPISSTLLRIKEGLNRHVTGLWTCVNQLNSTVRGQVQDIGGLKGTCQTLQNHVSNLARDLQVLMNSSPRKEGARVGLGEAEPPHISSTSLKVSAGPADPSLQRLPVIETGEAGPPGKMTSSQLPEGTNGVTMPVQGFAGAPASPVKPADSLKTSSPLIPDVPQRPPPQKASTASGEKVSFSAGLTLPPFQGEVGIIRFNKVIVNDGGHYDPESGIFTAPADGRYLVTAVLGARRGDRIQAVLSVSNRSIQRLDSAGFPFEADGTPSHGQCNCSGSASLSLVVSMRRGDRAGLVLTSGKLATSDSPEILSSFSVVLLYADPLKR